MSQVAVADLTPMEKQELLCVYSSLLLYDDGFDITKENITKVLNSVGVKVEPYLPMLFARALKGKDLNALFGSVSSGGGVGAPSTAVAGSSPVAGGEAAKPEEPEEEEEEEDDDMGFSLFD